jgi:dihydroorotase-like cyclic amidohydrolase
MTLQDYVRVASEGPARTWGLYPRKGAIAVGSDADMTVVDMERSGVIEAARMHGKNNHNPYEGRRTTAEPVGTIVRGEVVMRDGELVGTPRGRMVQRT